MPLLHDCDWLDLYLGCCYEQSAAGRLVACREPGRPAPPRFLLLRSRHGNLWRFGADEETAAVRRLARLAAKERVIAGPASEPWCEPERLESLRRILAETRPLQAEGRGPIYRFPRAAAARDLRRDLGRAAIPVPDDDPSLAASFPGLAERLAAQQPCFGVREAGRWLSVCYSACGDPMRTVAARVETDASVRRRGLGLRCVAAWGEAVMQLGGVPLYASGWRPRAARGLAARLGLELYGEQSWLA